MRSKIKTIITLALLPSLAFGQEPSTGVIGQAHPTQLDRVYENDKVYAEYRYDGKKRIKTAIYYLSDESGHPSDTTVWVCSYTTTGKVGAAGCISNRKKGLFKYFYTPDGKLDCVKGSDSFSVCYTYDKTGRVTRERICSTNGQNGRLQLVVYIYDRKNNIISLIRQYYAFPAANPGHIVYLYTKKYNFHYDKAPNPQPPIASWFLYNFLDLPGNWYSAHNLTDLTWQYMDGNTDLHSTSFHYVYDENGYPLKAVAQTMDGSSSEKTYYFEYLQ
jgi:hypothetical protein